MTLRILYVEDDPDIREIAVFALEELGGFTVCACESGEIALERAAAFRADVVLLDVMMPGLDGPATLAELRARDLIPNASVAFMTAKIQRDEVESLRAHRVDEILAKPFDPMTLPSQIRALAEGPRD